MIDLTVGIVNYNTRCYLDGCLASIYNQTTRYDVEVVMVDNASTDGSVEWLRQKYPQVRLMLNKANVGVARGNNQTIQHGQGRYIFLLNSDTILMPGALDRLIDFLDQHNEAGAVGGKLIFEDGTFQSSYDNFPTLWMEFLGATQLGSRLNPRFPSNPDCDEVHAVDWISSASLVIRKSAVEKIGLIDENYFIYSDETDLQFRLHKAGWKVYFLPEVKTVHFGGRSLNRWRRRRLVYRGKILYFHKNLGCFQATILRLIYLALSGLKIVFWSLVFLVPRHRQRAKEELHSNVEIIKMCLKRYSQILTEFLQVFAAA